MLDNNETTYLNDLMIKVRELRCKESFHEIFKCFYPRVKTYLIQGGIEREKASEMAQEVLLVVWHKSFLFDAAKGSLASWVFAVARNMRFDHFRSNKSETLRVTADDIFESIQDTSVHLELDVQNSEVRAQIEFLPVEQKEAIRAMYFDGYSHAEYSEMKDIPIGTVKSRIRLAFAHLKRALEEK